MSVKSVCNPVLYLQRASSCYLSAQPQLDYQQESEQKHDRAPEAETLPRSTKMEGEFARQQFTGLVYQRDLK